MLNSLILSFARFLGLFLISPLFSKKGISLGIRWGLSLICTLLLAPHFYINLSSGLSSSYLEEFAPQILGFHDEVNGHYPEHDIQWMSAQRVLSESAKHRGGQGPFTSHERTRDASKLSKYEGEKPRTQVTNLSSGLSIQDPIAVVIQSFQELFIGYLIGFLFSLIFEAAAFAGQLIGTMMGLSATELLDPILTSSQPLLARFFSFIAFILFFALDLHHALLRLLYETFHLFPPLKYPLTLEMGNAAIQGISLLFKQALSLAIVPLTMLFSLIVIFAIISRFLPIFWVGFPLQLLVGMLVLGSTLYLFIPFVEKGFSAFSNLVQKLFC